VFLGNDVLLNAVQLITFLYFTNIRNILSGCYNLQLHFSKSGNVLCIHNFFTIKSSRANMTYQLLNLLKKTHLYYSVFKQH